MTINKYPVTVLNVALHCDKTKTPWCDCTQNFGNSDKAERDKILAAIPPQDIIAPKIDRKKHISRDG